MDRPKNSSDRPAFLRQVFRSRTEDPSPILVKKARELTELTNKIFTWTDEEYHRFNYLNRDKNRYLYFVPYERSRVKLRYKGNAPGMEYINASYLQYNESKYIASQAPIPSTFADFWNMIWEQDVHIIVMLVDIQERKCEKYWSDNQKLYFDKVSVELESETVLITGEVTKRIFKIEKDGECRTLTQVHYITWPDHGIPLDHEAMKRVLIETRPFSNGQSPVLVHCSAGVGRTGTFCVLDTIINHCSSEGTDDLVIKVTKTFRDQRYLLPVKKALSPYIKVEWNI